MVSFKKNTPKLFFHLKRNTMLKNFELKIKIEINQEFIFFKITNLINFSYYRQRNNKYRLKMLVKARLRLHNLPRLKLEKLKKSHGPK